MINSKAKLSDKIFKKDIELVPNRQGYGEGLVAAGEKDERVVVLCADVTESTRSHLFKEKFPDRFIEVGVAEQAMANLAAGFALAGKIPFISSYAVFSPGRNWEQIRTTIAINDVPVKIAGSHAGLNVGPDGATHQMLEDIALMRALPNLTVIVPADSFEAQKATLEASQTDHPVYLRLAREESPVMTTQDSPFKIGRAETLWESKAPQAAIIGAGPLLYEALLAARELAKSKIECLVINSHSVKPLDTQAVIHCAKVTGAVVSVEEHQVHGGLGSAVAETLSKNFPVPIEMVAVSDTFGESGSADELLTKYGLKSANIVEAVKKVITRKNA